MERVQPVDGGGWSAEGPGHRPSHFHKTLFKSSINSHLFDPPPLNYSAENPFACFSSAEFH